MKSSPLHREDTNPGFQIAPMVDVVFVLMLFFMACAGFHAHERALDAAFAGPPRFPDTLPQTIAVTIAADGAVFVNNQPVGIATDRRLSGLTTWLRDVRAAFGDGDILVIRPAPTITHERVIEVLDAAAASGWQKLTFG